MCKYTHIYVIIVIKEEIIIWEWATGWVIEGKGEGGSDVGQALIYEVLKKNKIIKLTNQKNPKILKWYQAHRKNSINFHYYQHHLMN